jgi:hypothetical protein
LEPLPLDGGGWVGVIIKAIISNKNFGKMIKVGIKYCGGCNPYYDRVALVRQIEKRLGERVEFVSAANDDVDLVLAVEGCNTACADLSSFDNKEIRIISKTEDADDFIQDILS